jgi:hypothetical protein
VVRVRYTGAVASYSGRTDLAFQGRYNATFITGDCPYQATSWPVTGSVDYISIDLGDV